MRFWDPIRKISRMRTRSAGIFMAHCITLSRSVDRTSDPWQASAMTSARVRCHVNAPRAKVYRALLDAGVVQQWMVPTGMTSQVHAFDTREGGAFRISLTYPVVLSASFPRLRPVHLERNPGAKRNEARRRRTGSGRCRRRRTARTSTDRRAGARRPGHTGRRRRSARSQQTLHSSAGFVHAVTASLASP